MKTTYNKGLTGLFIAWGLLLGTPVTVAAMDNKSPVPLRIDILKEALAQPTDDIITGSIQKNTAPAGADKVITGSVLKENELLNYCFNISDAATEARSSMLKEKLEKIETRVDKKLTKLAKRIKVLKKWTQRRDQFLQNANDSLIQIFQSMRPDAAALQMTELGPGLASAIIAKLEPKYSSAILTEMKPEDAADITKILTTAMDTDGKKKK